MNILPTAYASRQGESQQRYESASNELQVIYRENLAAEQPTQSEKKSAVDIVNELRSKAAAKTSQPAPQQEAPEQAEAKQDDQPQGNKADSSSDNLDKVRSYRKFETERYVNDRLFRDGFLEVLSPAAVKLLLFIGSKCNDDGVCYHSHETMSKITGLSVKTIKRTMPELINNKLIDVKAVAGKSNHYRLL
ncbi:TPA: helix-turn-helix domain-containing protein [Escherichia coli]|nr:helix-turn-helix domain-containing protein [Escherichia coli]MCQ5915258.1 helix-turn-helix domain-containing protein [Escherichia coli]MCQ5950667.1 helix-turn-helix domain-containing protein [Escherichia coli]MCQ6059754.1 helix-turn-helix domain-containing protein [Escherichia coli]HCA4460749.1 helix-turn-helix domain-containing protein [Escherichia coli]